MSGFRIETVTKTYCTECGDELHSAEDWSRHRSRHTIEYYANSKDPAVRRTWEMMQLCYTPSAGTT